MSDKVKPTDLEESAHAAEDQTEKFIETGDAGREKTEETSDDMSEGMPKTDRENIDKVTKTD
ncbi:MAG: hypothetical protein VX874_20105 [Pseudomonadota bacterium]|nr:hypothetical protein [Pseudomonadota bacterium]